MSEKEVTQWNPQPEEQEAARDPPTRDAGPNIPHEKNGRIDASIVGRERGSSAWNPETP
jgi:hypothetical protein